MLITKSFSSSQQEDALLTYLLDTELQAMSSIKRTPMTSPIGIARVKEEPDLELNSIFQNKYILDCDRFDVSQGLLYLYFSFSLSDRGLNVKLIKKFHPFHLRIFGLKLQSF